MTSWAKAAARDSAEGWDGSSFRSASHSRQTRVGSPNSLPTLLTTLVELTRQRLARLDQRNVFNRAADLTYEAQDGWDLLEGKIRR